MPQVKLPGVGTLRVEPAEGRRAPPLNELKPVKPKGGEPKNIGERGDEFVEQRPHQKDGALQEAVPAAAMPAPLRTFEGRNNEDNFRIFRFRVNPPIQSATSARGTTSREELEPEQPDPRVRVPPVRDLGIDTAVAGGDGRFSATLSDGWDIWGPQGGYVAGVALRAAAAATSFPRPASLACNFLRPAQAGPVDARVESLRRTKRAESLEVTLAQNDVPLAQVLVWAVAELGGIDHFAGGSPEVPPATELQPWDAFFPGGEPPFPFWRNFDIRPVIPPPSEWGSARDPTSPRSIAWARLRVRPALEDPFVDAARMLTVADSAMYPAATLAHAEPFPYIAPSLDLVMSFHVPDAASEWVLVEAESPISAGALVAGKASLWSAEGRLLASAMQQMLQRT